MKFRLTLATGAALGAIALAVPAAAQEAPAEDENAIIVTARRQSESLADVPASVTVLGADAIAKTGVQRADDFVQLTPGVTIVTARAADGTPVGLTANSFNSVSLDPPLVLWSLRTAAHTMPTFARGTHYAIHILAADQLDLAKRFATRDIGMG